MQLRGSSHAPCGIQSDGRAGGVVVLGAVRCRHQPIRDNAACGCFRLVLDAGAELVPLLLEISAACSDRRGKLGVHLPVSLKKGQNGQGRLAAARIALHELRQQPRQL